MHRVPSFPGLARALGATILFAWAASGHALTTHCVATSQELSQALSSASTSTDSLVLIRLRQGTYDAFEASYPFTYTAMHSNQVVEISGGWSGAAGTCQSNAIDPSLTRIIGTTDRVALAVATGTTNDTSGNQLYLHDVSIGNPNYTSASVSGACLKANVNPGNEIRIERVQLRDCVATNGAYAAAFLSNSGGTLTVRDVAAWNNLALHSGGIAVTTGNGGDSTLSHITVLNSKSMAGDATTNAGLLLSMSDANSTTALGNSVSWGNSGYVDPSGQVVTVSDVLVSGPGIDFTRVHRGSTRGTPASDLGAGDGDPAFVGTHDPHLRSDSLLVDSGVTAPEGGSGVFDADGAPRVRGAAVDVGAFEADPDVVFANAFD